MRDHAEVLAAARELISKTAAERGAVFEGRALYGL